MDGFICDVRVLRVLPVRWEPKHSDSFDVIFVCCLLSFFSLFRSFYFRYAEYVNDSKHFNCCFSPSKTAQQFLWTQFELCARLPRTTHHECARVFLCCFFFFVRQFGANKSHMVEFELPQQFYVYPARVAMKGEMPANIHSPNVKRLHNSHLMLGRVTKKKNNDVKSTNTECVRSLTMKRRRIKIARRQQLEAGEQ